jgi:hypothetical protein
MAKRSTKSATPPADGDGAPDADGTAKGGYTLVIVESPA